MRYGANDLADGVRVRVVRAPIASVMARGEPASAKGGKDTGDDDEADSPGAGDKVTTIAMRFRARNGFGGMDVETATGTVAHADCTATVDAVRND